MELVPSWIFRKLSYSAISAGLAAGRLVVRILPRRLLFRLSDSLARFAFASFHGFRTRSMANLEVAFKGSLSAADSRRIVYRSLRSFVRACAEAGVALDCGADELRETIPVSGRDHLDAAMAR